MKHNALADKDTLIYTRSPYGSLLPVFYIFTLLFAAASFLLFFRKHLESGAYSDPSLLMNLYILLAFLELFLLLFLPPLTSGRAFSGERKSETLEALLTSGLSPFSIFMGKLLAATKAFLFFQILSLPLFSLFFFTGSIGLTEILTLQLYILLVGLACIAVSMHFSLRFQKSTRSTAVSLILFLFFYLMLPLLLLISPLIESFLRGEAYTKGPFNLPGAEIGILLSPFFSLLSILQASVGSSSGIYSYMEQKGYPLPTEFLTRAVGWNSLLSLTVFLLFSFLVWKRLRNFLQLS